MESIYDGINKCKYCKKNASGTENDFRESVRKKNPMMYHLPKSTFKLRIKIS